MYFLICSGEQSDPHRNYIVLNKILINAEKGRHLIKTTGADSSYLAKACSFV